MVTVEFYKKTYGINYSSMMQWMYRRDIPFSCMDKDQQQSEIKKYLDAEGERIEARKKYPDMSSRQRGERIFFEKHGVNRKNVARWCKNNGFDWVNADKKTREKLIEGYRKLGQRKFTPTTPKERGLEYE